MPASVETWSAARADELDVEADDAATTGSQHRAGVILMKHLGYAQFVAQGGDLYADVCTVMAKEALPGLLGIHTNFPGTILPDIAKALQAGDPPPLGLSPDERRAYERLNILFTRKRAYAQMMGHARKRCTDWRIPPSA